MTKIRIALADDHPVVLEGVKALLRSSPDVELVGTAHSGATALQLVADEAPDIAIIDISMPDLGGIELAGQLAERHPNVKVIALTVHESRAYVQRLLKAGARGYLLKRSAADELGRAIRAVSEGGVYLDPAIAAHAVSPRAAASSQDSDEEQLSAREEEVLRLIAQGLSNKEAAARLELSVKTIETYKSRAVEKKHLRNRADIVRYAAKKGWLGPAGTE
jgi:DNA-binding NarL/FixJ family response regulator